MSKDDFDAVKLMRDLRDRLSDAMRGMSPEERMHYIREKAASSGLADPMPGVKASDSEPNTPGNES